MASNFKISLRVGEYYFRKNHSLDRVFIIEVYIFGVTIMKTTMNSLLCANDSSWNWSCANQSRWRSEQQPIFSLKGPVLITVRGSEAVRTNPGDDRSNNPYFPLKVQYWKVRKHLRWYQNLIRMVLPWYIPLAARSKPSLCFYFFFDVLFVWICAC